MLTGEGKHADTRLIDLQAFSLVIADDELRKECRFVDVQWKLRRTLFVCL